MNASHAQAAPKSREIRIGLVMYGGVSLAIYINGVAREFFNAVRGRGAYKLLKAVTDSDIVVDIMSGTSAGGINGILLSYALCNNKEFGDCANLWRQHGDIGRLLRDPDAAPEQTYSLLDSEGYYQQCLEEAFAGMADCAASIPPEDCSALDELDLYITSTFADGRTYTVLDDAGHAIDVKDNRAVFVLKHRSGRKEPFNPGWHQKGAATPPPEATHQALAKLGRMTSCFPVAFEPVQVKVRKGSEPAADSAAEDWADFKLQEWGALKKEAYFLDGGVLDNKPFTYTIKEIFHRTTERDVKRTLFYVDPDPEKFEQTGSPQQPNVVRAAMLGLVGIPGYQSIAEDLKLIAERNDKVKTYERLRGFLAKSDINVIDKQVSAATAEFIDRLNVGMGAATGPSPENRSAYENCRLIALSQRVVQGLLRDDGEDRKLDQDKRREAEHLFAKFDEKISPDVKMKMLRDFDIDFRLRRLFHTIYSYAEKDQADTKQAANVFVLNRQLKLLEIVRNAMERLIDEANFQWQGRDAEAIWGDVAAAADLLLDNSQEPLLPAGYPKAWKAGPDWLNLTQLDKFNEGMKKRLVDVIIKVNASSSNTPLSSPSKASSLLHDTDRYEQLRLDEFARQGGAAKDVKQRYEEFIYFDALLFPIELFGDLREKDYIATVRMSPPDAKRGFSKLPAEDKTAGQALHHFAGFFKRSWRSNDILWGRLDAACLLLEHYFEPKRISKVVLRQDLASALRKRIDTGGDLDPAGLFPNAPPETQDSLRKSLQELLSQPGPDQKAFDQMLERLIEATQLEILHEDLHKALADANFEEELRNRCTAKDFIDPLSAMARADAEAAQKMTAAIPPTKAPPAGPKQTPVGKFFADTYRGNNHGKFLDSVPVLDLLEILSTALLVLRNALLTAMGDQAKRVQAHALYAWLDRGLRLFHGVVVFVRRASPMFLASMFILFGASAIALAVGITWRADILYPNDQWQLRWLFAFIIVPGLIIATQAYWLIQHKGWRRTIYAVVLVGTVAAVTFWRHEIGDWLADLLSGLAARLRA